ncbi:hypothetical protein PPERSA_06970 [Pseudocohnilembus persalinus]|uniref:Transmembrane protein n=1 Tax=Pseudocohnilembus persalinus TaxID=266149 RepID=A0A0V0QYK5_PSEPJ|nr:hypothetical protein PPERSA_06970 [Pseudocohnilembus persalinus]|eukprot:KRX07355.1 hypothetical protein PPERSA_06970 [Pseudocohnilembus persalinus]
MLRHQYFPISSQQCRQKQHKNLPKILFYRTSNLSTSQKSDGSEENISNYFTTQMQDSNNSNSDENIDSEDESLNTQKKIEQLEKIQQNQKQQVNQNPQQQNNDIIGLQKLDEKIVNHNKNIDLENQSNSYQNQQSENEIEMQVYDINNYAVLIGVHGIFIFPILTNKQCEVSYINFSLISSLFISTVTPLTFFSESFWANKKAHHTAINFSSYYINFS